MSENNNKKVHDQIQADVKEHITNTSHRRIRLAIGIRLMERFGETRSFFGTQSEH